MSGPNAPAGMGGPIRLPGGATRKPMGGERIPTSGEVPLPNPGTVRMRTAARMGVDPTDIVQRPGYTPPQGQVPRAASTGAPPAVQPPVPVAESIPLPRPRPVQAGAQTRSVAGVPGADMSFADRFAPAMEIPPSGGDPRVQALRKFGQMQMMDPDAQAQELKYQKGVQMLAAAMAAQRGQGPRDVPKGAPAGPASPSRGIEPPVPTAPPAAAPSNPPGGRFVPSQETGVYMMKDPNAPDPTEKKGRGRPRDEKQKVNKEAKKGSNLYIYQTLGIDPQEGKTGIAQAMRRLQDKAERYPWLLTRDEDRLLASASDDVLGRKSLKEEDVQARFEEYEKKKPKDGSPVQDIPKKKRATYDPAEDAAANEIQRRGAPAYSGNRYPTQEDVNAGKTDPSSFKAKFPEYASPAKQPETEEEE